MPYKIEIVSNYFVIEDTDTSIAYRHPAADVTFEVNNSKYEFKNKNQSNEFIFQGKNRIDFADLQDSTGTAWVSEAALNTWMYAMTGGGASGGGGGSGDASQAQQIILGTKIDTLIAEQDNPSIIAKLEELRVIDATDSTAISNILTKLQEQGLELDKIDSLKTSTDAVKTAIDNAEAAEVLRDANELAALNNIIAKDEEVKQEVLKANQEIVAAINNQTQSDVETVIGIDTGNSDLEVIRRTNTVDNSISYFDYQNNDITGSFVGPFASDPDQNKTVDLDFLFVKIAGSGYDLDDEIERTIIRSGTTIISTSYRNITKGADLITANVVETDFGKTPPPNTSVELLFRLVDQSTREIKGIVTEIVRSDGSVIYRNTDNTITNSPVLAGEELVPITRVTTDFKNGGHTFPLIFEANTKTTLDVIPISGEYTISINDGPAQTLKDTSSGLSFPSNKEGGLEPWVTDKIEINEVSSGELEIYEAQPKLQGDSVPDTGVNAQFFTDANSDFWLDATGDRVEENAGSVTRVLQVTETGSTENFTTANTQTTKGTEAGLQFITGDSGSDFSPISKTSVNIASAVYLWAGKKDLGSSGGLFRFLSPTIQLSNLAGSSELFYNVGNTGTIPYAAAGFNADELAGTKAFIIAVRRTNINSNANTRIEFVVYNQANPTGLSIATEDRSFTSNSVRSVALGSGKLSYAAYIDLSQETNAVNIMKTGIGF